jgi:hypothetical protein
MQVGAGGYSQVQLRREDDKRAICMSAILPVQQQQLRQLFSSEDTLNAGGCVCIHTGALWRGLVIMCMPAVLPGSAPCSSSIHCQVGSFYCIISVRSLRCW